MNKREQAGERSVPVVVLGSRLVAGKPDALMRERLDKALAVAGNRSVFVVTGFGEAHAMRDYLVAQGVAARRVIVEPRATSTNENLENAYRILRRRHSSWAVVTNDFHVLRTRLWAWHLGHYVKVLSAPTPWADKLRNYSRELVALPHSFLRILLRKLRG